MRPRASSRTERFAIQRAIRAARIHASLRVRRLCAALQSTQAVTLRRLARGRRVTALPISLSLMGRAVGLMDFRARMGFAPAWTVSDPDLISPLHDALIVLVI